MIALHRRGPSGVTHVGTDDDESDDYAVRSCSHAIMLKKVVGVRTPVKRSRVMLIDVEVPEPTTGVATSDCDTALTAY
jgi:hypothetical protein